MENITPEVLAALYRASDTAVLCTRGNRILFANPAAVQFLGEDPAGQSAARILPERLVQLQGSMGASSARIRNRDAVITLSGAGLFRVYYLQLLPGNRQTAPPPNPQWTALANLRMAAEHFDRCASASEEDRLNAGALLKSYYQLQRWFQNVSTLAGLQDGTLPLQLQAADCAELVTQMAETLRPLAEPRGIQVLASVPAEPSYVMLDETLIHQLLMNLLLNSLLHCAEGDCIRLGLSLSGDSFTLSVLDTGEGIPPERIGTVFESYDLRPIPGRERAGCGLPVALGVARLHGGELLLGSTPRAGTQVLVTLPVRNPAHSSFGTGSPGDYAIERDELFTGLADYLRPEDFRAE